MMYKYYLHSGTLIPRFSSRIEADCAGLMQGRRTSKDYLTYVGNQYARSSAPERQLPYNSTLSTLYHRVSLCRSIDRETGMMQSEYFWPPQVCSI